MVHTVGLLGVNGLLGNPTAKVLAQFAREGKLNLVLLHREGKPPKDIDAQHENIELRIIDLDAPASQLEEAVKGINVFISAISVFALSSEANLADALAKSPDLVTFMPSLYSTTWTEEDLCEPKLGGMLKMLHTGWDRAKEKNVGITVVYNGIFDNYFFEMGFVGCSIKQNIVWANEKQLKNPVPITTIDHLSQGVAQLAASDPQSIKNTEHSFVTFWPTGNELVELYTKVNGKPAEVKDFTKKDREDKRNDEYGLASVGYWDHWEKGDWEYKAGEKVYHEDYEGPTIEEVAKRFSSASEARL